jgi:hypothetical protein
MSRALTAFTIAALVSATVPSPAFASAPAPSVAVDEVHLHSGGFLRGEIVEYMPGSHVVIIPRGSTESRRIEWSEMAEIVRGGTRETTAGTLPPPPQPDPVPVPVAEPEPEPQPEPQPGLELPSEGALIHINQTRYHEPVLLFHIDGEAVASGGGYTAHAIAYSEICESPCDVVLKNHRGQFFIGGQKKYSPSARFRLSGDYARYDLDVTPRKKGIRIGGYVLMVSSIVAAGFMAVGPLLVDMPKKPHANGMWAGAGLVGAFGIGGGIAMMILGRTKVVVTPRSR